MKANHTLGLAAALVVVLANVATAAGPATAVRPTPTSTQSGGPQEGVKVHGRWTIVVRNPDGAVASRNEFENALGPIGARYLVATLARLNTPGGWRIGIDGGICGDGTATCYVAEPGFAQSPTIAPTLSVSMPQEGPDAGRLVLSGSTRATRAGTVTSVLTSMSECAREIAPATSCFAGGPPFTIRGLSIGIPIVAGQTIDLTVVISFS